MRGMRAPSAARRSWRRAGRSSSPVFDGLGDRGAAHPTRLRPAHLAPRRPQALSERRLPVLADQPQLHLVVGACVERGPGGRADAVETHLAQRCFAPSAGGDKRVEALNNGAQDPASQKPCQGSGPWMAVLQPTLPSSAPPRAQPEPKKAGPCGARGFGPLS